MSDRPTRREIIETFIPNSPHAAQLGIRVISIGSDEAVLELPYKPELATIGNVVHGGAVGALRVIDAEGAVLAHGIATYRFG